jgi:hypothetical protein
MDQLIGRLGKAVHDHENEVKIVEKAKNWRKYYSWKKRRNI